jgi:hypothetical protein
MNHRIVSAAWLLLAALPPSEVKADIIDLSEVNLFAFASFKTQGQPDQTDSAINIVPHGSVSGVEAFVCEQSNPGILFPNVPTSQTRPFASSAADGNGFFGVGVNGFFFPNSLPPNALLGGRSVKERRRVTARFPRTGKPMTVWDDFGQSTLQCTQDAIFTRTSDSA